MESAFPERLSAIFQAEADRLKSDIKKAEGEFNHNTLKGSTAEQVAQDFLRRYFPPEYGFGKGQIIDSTGSDSKEIDIAICNPSHPFTYEREGRGIFFIETVDAVIEVKSTLGDIEGIIDHCRSVRNLSPKSKYGGNHLSKKSMDRIRRTPYAVFSFGTDYKLGTIKRKLEELQEEEYNYIDLVYVLGKGLIYYERSELRIHDHFKASHKDDTGGYVINEISPDLLVFLMLLSDKMPDVQDPAHPLAAYLSPKGNEKLR